MLTPDNDARRMLVRERHAELSRDALAPVEAANVALERWSRGLRRIRASHLWPDSNAAPRRIEPAHPTKLVRTEEKS